MDLLTCLSFADGFWDTKEGNVSLIFGFRVVRVFSGVSDGGQGYWRWEERTGGQGIETRSLCVEGGAPDVRSVWETDLVRRGPTVVSRRKSRQVVVEEYLRDGLVGSDVREYGGAAVEY